MRWSIRTRLIALMFMLVAVTASVIVLSYRSAHEQHMRALVDNVAGRQPVLAQRYAKEVILAAGGLDADPTATEVELLNVGEALLEGGRVTEVQGSTGSVVIHGASEPTVRATLAEELRLDDGLVRLGRRLLTEDATTQSYRRDAAHLENLSNLAAGVGHDAVGRMTLLADRAVTRNSRIQIALAAVGILVALAFAHIFTSLIVRRLRVLSEVATARAGGDAERRYPVTGNDEITAVSQALNLVADHLDGIQAKLTAGAERDGFAKQLVDAFEMAEDEPAACRVVERSMAAIAEGDRMELLLADSSKAHLERVAVSPSAGAAGCTVQSPYSCVAVRRANPVVFPSSAALDSCPRLADRRDDACSAVCLPVSFMGKSLGVLHVTGPVDAPPDAGVVSKLAALAGQVGARIGTLRAFEQTQLQASTDGLTGLINRRTFENEARALLAAHKPFALVLADLDLFKELNDTYGHDAGDRALRVFAETVRGAARADDFVCRYGGEEFALLLPGATKAVAAQRLEQIRASVAEVTASGTVPAFTATYGITDTDDAGSLDELVRIADRALYAGKDAGRDRVVIGPVTAAPLIAAQRLGAGGEHDEAVA